MPFIELLRRDKIDEEGLESLSYIKPGDICYKYYKEMIERWKQNPCWSTAHEIYKNLHHMPIGIQTDDEYIAQELAWQVFFNLIVMEYEQIKRRENGDIW